MDKVTYIYSVSFGPKHESDREWAHFDDIDQAAEFFNQKWQAGFHVDAYEEKTVRTRTKLSSKEQ